MDLAAALDRWRTLLGDEHVSVEPGALGAAATTTFATTARVLAIVRPATRADVQAIVRIAGAHGVPLHPTSGGKNWGYGSRVPPRDAVLLDLARLDRIVDFDERLAYVTVEPGVTFRRLAAFLRDCRARVFASVTGGPADGSVIANALERGDGAGPLGDRFAHACGLEVVLGDGSVIETGFPSHTAVAPLHRWGVGPALDGLFSQATWGVVTRMTVWLTPYPAHFQLASVAFDDARALPAIVDALRELRLAGVTPATIPIWNDLKGIALVRRYPWDAANGATPLPDALRAQLRAETGFARWNATVSLYAASRPHGAALRDIVHRALAGHARLAFRDGPDEPLDAEPDDCGPALGVPHDHNIASMYWRKRGPIRDPDLDRCGFIWLSHALPFDGEHARDVDALVEAELGGAGFEPSLALLGITGRVLSAVPAIVYDRDVPGEDDRARACHDRLFAALVARGIPPFRTGIQSLANPIDPATSALLTALRTILDRDRVLG